MSDTDALRLADYPGHILEAIDRIHRYVAGLDDQEFLRDEKSQDAVIRNFEILGEAANCVARFHSYFALAHADVPWALMYTMRNRVAHGYFNLETAVDRFLALDTPYEL